MHKRSKCPPRGAAVATRQPRPRYLWWAYAASVVLLAGVVALGIWLGQPVPGAVATSASKQMFATARVARVAGDDAVADDAHSEGRRIGTQTLEVTLLSGAHKGETLPLTNYLSALFNVDVAAGDRVIVRVLEDGSGGYYLSLFNYDRGLVLGGLVLVFFLLLGALGGKKGLGALGGLLLALACLWFILIPGLLRGLPALPLTIGVTAAVAASSLVLLNGYGRKTFCAVAGCVCGVVTAGLVAALVGAVAPINGWNMTEAEDLLLYGAEHGLHIRGLLVCGVLIASLGAVMDVALSLASAIAELHSKNPALPARELFLSGMRIGRDAMGTMANTLILAFAGSSLNMLVLIQTYGIPFLQLVNTDFICIEVIQSIAGSIGILLTVPLVAFISARCMARDAASANR
ncbi:MAG: YibE/F family protein [Gemmiger sp.]|nr:YibE/F family protein [Gemmiger sp.]